MDPTEYTKKVFDELKTLSGITDDQSNYYPEPVASFNFANDVTDPEDKLKPIRQMDRIDINKYCKKKAKHAAKIIVWTKKELTTEDMEKFDDWRFIDGPKEGDVIYVPVGAAAYHEHEIVPYFPGVPYPMPDDETIFNRMHIEEEDREKVLELLRIQKLAVEFERIKAQEQEKAKVCGCEEQGRQKNFMNWHTGKKMREDDSSLTFEPGREYYGL